MRADACPGPLGRRSGGPDLQGAEGSKQTGRSMAPRRRLMGVGGRRSDSRRWARRATGSTRHRPPTSCTCRSGRCSARSMPSRRLRRCTSCSGGCGRSCSEPARSGCGRCPRSSGSPLIPIAYLCGRELVSRRAGLVAAALAAVSPFMIWYSQEAREYMLLAALCGASFLYFARAWRDPSGRNIAWWAVFSALALLTHFFAGFLVAPEAAVAALHRSATGRSRPRSAAMAAVELALVPLLVAHATHSLLGFITGTPLSIADPAGPGRVRARDPVRGPAVSDGLLGAAVLAGDRDRAADRRSRRGRASRRRRRRRCWRRVVVLVPLVVALLGKDYYIPRALIPAWVPLAVVVGAACTTPRCGIPAGASSRRSCWPASCYAHDQDQRRSRISAAGLAGRGERAGRARRASARSSPTTARLAADPLILYLHGVPWNQPHRPGRRSARSTWSGTPGRTLRDPLPPGYKLIAEQSA